MIGTLFFLTLLSSTVAWGVCLYDSTQILPFYDILTSNYSVNLPFPFHVSFFQHVGLWGEGSERNGTGGGGGVRCTCDAFLPGSTFPTGDLALVEQTAVEVTHTLELEMSKVQVLDILEILCNKQYKTDHMNPFIYNLSFSDGDL